MWKGDQAWSLRERFLEKAKNVPASVEWWGSIRPWGRKGQSLSQAWKEHWWCFWRMEGKSATLLKRDPLIIWYSFIKGWGLCPVKMGRLLWLHRGRECDRSDAVTSKARPCKSMQFLAAYPQSPRAQTPGSQWRCHVGRGSSIPSSSETQPLVSDVLTEFPTCRISSLVGSSKCGIVYFTAMDNRNK